MPERSPREPPPEVAAALGGPAEGGFGRMSRWMRAEMSETTPDEPSTRAAREATREAEEQAARYDADDEARLLYLRNMGSIADQRRQYWEDALGSISRRTTFIYLAGVVVFVVGVILIFLGVWLISRDETLISAIPALLGGVCQAALIPVTTIERGLSKDKVAAERALDKQSTVAHVSGIAAMTGPSSREHILADLAGRLIATIDDR